MTKKWVTEYQIRVEGAFGTTAGSVAEHRDGVSISLKGRLCSITARKCMAFRTHEEALNYLATRKDKDMYHFEVIECGSWV